MTKISIDKECNSLWQKVAKMRNEMNYFEVLSQLEPLVSHLIEINRKVELINTFPDLTESDQMRIHELIESSSKFDPQRDHELINKFERKDKNVQTN
jgi:hypothetical protein